MNRAAALPLAICGLLTLAMAIGIGRFAFTPLLPMMQKDGGLTLREAGFLASANYMGYLAGAVSAIWMRASTAAIVRWSMIAVAVLTAAMGATGNLPAWIVMRAAAGVASAWVLIFASAHILEQLAAQERKPFGGVVFGGVGTGIAVTGALCVVFLNLAWPPERSWIALGAVALLVALWCLPFYRDATTRKAVAASDAVPLQLRDHAAVIACYGVFGFGYIIPATFLPAMARQSIPDPAVFGWAWPIFGAAALVSTLLAGKLSVRFANRRIWAGSHAVMAVGVVVPVLLPGMAGIVLSACFVGGTFMVATMTGMQEARVIAPQHAPRLMAAMTAAFGIGQILGPLLVSAVAGIEGGMSALLSASCLLLLASAVVLHAPARRTGQGSGGAQ